MKTAQRELEAALSVMRNAPKKSGPRPTPRALTAAATTMPRPIWPAAVILLAGAASVAWTIFLIFALLRLLDVL
jgi:hypothetical protein